MCTQDKDFVHRLFSGVLNACDETMAIDMLLSDVPASLNMVLPPTHRITARRPRPSVVSSVFSQPFESGNRELLLLRE